MKKLTMMLIALALCMCAVMPVMALDDPKVPGYTNQYVEIKNDVSTAGQFFGHIRAGTNVFSNEVIVIGPIGQFTVPVNPDGTFEVTNTTPGKYTVYLLDGNGGQYEQSSFTIGAGQTSQLDSEILGHAFSATDDAKQPDVIVIKLATYGMTKTVCIQVPEKYTPVGRNHGDYDYVPYQDAYDTHNGDFSMTENPITHVKSYRHVGQGNGDYINVMGRFSYVAPTHHDAVPAHYEFVGAHHGDYTYTPAHPECSIEGSYITVTQQVQSAIDKGARSFFFFDNAQNPGGIFGKGNVLLEQITDPAPGQVKKVHIEYSINGNPKVIDANEYDVITI